MKLFFIGLAVIATAYAALPSNEYLPPLEDDSAVVPLDLQSLTDDSSVLADDGYRYKTLRRIRYRHRRDVNELPSNEYLPPVEISEPAPFVADVPVAFSAPVEESAVLADDGYRYKTVKRIRYRHRRDVNELPSNEYLPPVQVAAPVAAPVAQFAAPVAQVSHVAAPVAHVAAQVSHVAAPVAHVAAPVAHVAAPVAHVAAPVAHVAAPVAHVAAPVAHVAAPVVHVAAPVVHAAAPVQHVAAPVVAQAPIVVAEPVQESAVLADDGYRYKTVKRIRYRHRRDVNELPSNEYLPPVEVAAPVAAPVEHFSAPVAHVAAPVEHFAAPIVAAEPVHESAVLADDGYRYKTVKRIRYRHRRDVNELPSNEYLPPVEVAAPVAAPVEHFSAPVAHVAAPVEHFAAPIVAAEPVHESAVLADDGYRYKTVKRIRYRHRRDVNELPSNEYLPPVEVAAPVAAPVEHFSAPVAHVAAPVEHYAAPIVAAEPVHESAVLADDGYRYKTVKRIRYRHRRDVNELPSNEYLPPVEIAEPVAAPAPFVADVPVAISAPVQESAVLADDGYRYKTVKRIRYRHRRDVNELPSNEYLPPVEVAAPVEHFAAPVEHVSAPVAHVAAQVVAQAPIVVAEPVQESAVLADDGYRYKTVKRIRYRHRRDVNELPSNEYLPPVEIAEPVAAPAPFVADVPVAISAPVQESAVLADDGYRYKTVKRIRYRHRRDVNELPSNEYLPPVEVAAPVAAPVEHFAAPVAAPVVSHEVAHVVAEAPIAISAPVQESAVLADDGYRYKTQRRIRYRYRH